MIKVNFKQPKYIFPAVIFIPLCALVYFVMQTFGGGGEPEQAVATDRINTELPEAHAEEAGDKMYEMSRRFGDEDAFTAVGGIGEEKEEKRGAGTRLQRGGNWTDWTQRKQSASVGSRKWRNWNARWRSPGGTSIHTPMATMHLQTVCRWKQWHGLHFAGRLRP